MALMSACSEKKCVCVYLSLAEGQTGVDVFTVNPLQEAAAAVQHGLLLPRLKVTEELTVHLHATPVCTRLSEDIVVGRASHTLPESSYLSALSNDGLRGRRVRLRPQDGRGCALVSAVSLPERRLHPPSSNRGELTNGGGGGGQHQRLQCLDLGLEDIDLRR